MNNSIQPFTTYQKFLVVVLGLIQFTVVLDFMVLSPLGDVLMKSLELTPSMFGTVVSAYAFSAGGAGILAAGFADKFDRKKLLLFFYSGFILGTLFCALADSYIMMLLARIVTGLFGGVIGAISLAIVTDIFTINQRGRVMGVIQMGFAASQILGIPIGLYFSNLWGWHSAFLMIVVVAIITAVTIWLKMKPVNTHLAIKSLRNPFQHLWHTVAQKDYRVAFSATAFLSIGGFMLMPFGSAYLINNIRITHEQLPLVFLSSGVASIVIMPMIGKLSDRMNKFKLFAAGSLLAILMISIYTNLPPVPLWLVITINMVLFMGIMSRMIPAMSLTTGIPDAGDRGAFMSVNSSIQQMAGGIAAICAGLIVTQRSSTAPLEHYPTLGLVVSSAIVVCGFLLYRVSELVKKKTAIMTADVQNQKVSA